MNPISKNETMLYHKTTDRRAYSQAQEGVSANHEVILWNKEGEITETSIANIVVRTQGRLITPSVSCGLLPGTFRDFLLRGNIIQEGVITIDELQEADAIYLVNSLRGWRKGELATASDRKSFSPGIAV
jgi:para-aminobenzoate synthetase/4-amino-4-deoxychorismate lyase